MHYGLIKTLLEKRILKELLQLYIQNVRIVQLI